MILCPLPFDGPDRPTVFGKKNIFVSSDQMESIQKALACSRTVEYKTLKCWIFICFHVCDSDGEKRVLL